MVKLSRGGNDNDFEDCFNVEGHSASGKDVIGGISGRDA